MPKFKFHMGVTLRCYGDVEVEADTVEKAAEKLTPEFVGENIIINETTTDHPEDMAIIDAYDADDNLLGPFCGIDLLFGDDNPFHPESPEGRAVERGDMTPEGATPATKARVKCTDNLGNVAYIHHGDRGWRCTLANGIPASMSYAGVSGDETGFRFKLDDCRTADAVLSIVRLHSSCKCELV